jgi:hypothetical protein
LEPLWLSSKVNEKINQIKRSRVRSTALQPLEKKNKKIFFLQGSLIPHDSFYCQHKCTSHNYCHFPTI